MQTVHTIEINVFKGAQIKTLNKLFSVINIEVNVIKRESNVYTLTLILVLKV